MQAVVNLFISVFQMLFETEIFELPLLVWFLIPVLISVLLHMIKSGKEKDS